MTFGLYLYLARLMFIIAIIDPTISIKEAVTLPVPKVTIITQEHFVNDICPCGCSMNAIYGRFYLDKDNKPTLLLVTMDGRTIPNNDIGFDALTIHELTHYIQYMQGKWGNAATNGAMELSAEEYATISNRMEMQAYQNQNKYLKHHNMPALPVHDSTAWSTRSNMGTCNESISSE